MTDEDFAEMELALWHSGMPTYCDLLMSITRILEPPEGQPWGERQAYLLEHIAAAKERVARANSQLKLASVNASLAERKAGRP